jgi:predicted RNase H-like HicB family nuclease
MASKGNGNRVFTAIVEYDEDSKMFVGSVPGVRGAHTQATTLDELNVNLKEVLELCLAEFHGEEADLPRFIGLQQIEIAG